MSTNGIVLPPVNISDLRGTDAANKLKASTHGGNAKVEKSAKEFEAVLLSHWLDQAQQSFATVPGSDKDEESDPGRDQFHSLAMQAVGTALSGGRGGLGIAAMVAKHLEKKAAADQSISHEIKHLDRPFLLGATAGDPEGKK
jgi:Rod binding domain-containing protein